MKHTWVFVVVLFVELQTSAVAQLRQPWGKLVGTGAVGLAVQGNSVALSSSGTTAIVGGPGDNVNVGAAWVFIRTGGLWTQQGNKITATGGVGGALLGVSSAISADGNTALIGGSGDNADVGAAWVFTRTNGVWTQQGGKLVGSGGAGRPEQGWSVALSSDGNTAIVGGREDSAGVGAVWVFTRAGGIWTQQGAKLTGSGAVGAAEQGWSVSLSADGNTAIEGGPSDNSTLGAAWVFTRTGGVWTQQGAKLIGAGAVGSASQGWSVALSSDGNTAIVGGRFDNGGAGASWVYTRTNGVWSQQGRKLVGTDAVGNAEQGWSVALSSDGNTAIEGGQLDDAHKGAAWIFTRTGAVWTQSGNKLVGTGEAGAGQQGWSVALSSDAGTAIVGGATDSGSVGAAWVFANAQPRVSSVQDIPFDQGGTVAVDWDRSSGDTPPDAFVTSYWVWRGVRSASVPGNPVALTRSEYLGSMANGLLDRRTYMTIPRQPAGELVAGDIYWQYMTSLPSHGLAHYSYLAPTLADSTPQGIPWRYFFITAATVNQDVYWDSPADSGYSLDNLPPGTPANPAISGLPRSRVLLKWSPDRIDPDFSHFVVYRSTSSGFSVSGSTRIQTTVDSTFIDSSAAGGQAYYYRITTADIHGNESTPTAELAITVSSVHGNPGGPLPVEFGLSQNYPNPFNPTTRIEFALPVRSFVRLDVYNTLGQIVSRLVSGETDAGYHEVTFDAAGLASGVYLYRMQAGTYEQVKKLAVVR